MTSSAEKKPIEQRQALTEVTSLPATERGGSTKAHAAALRRSRLWRLVGRLALFVLLPTLASGTYFGLLATPQFESHAVFTVRSSELRPTLGMEGLLSSLATGSGSQDALAVRDYVLSRDMLARLDREQAFIAHYKAAKADWFTRLRQDASFEEAFDYFGEKVFADYDTVSGSITLRVRALDAEKAQSLAKSVLACSEEMVNKLSERQRRDRTAYAEADVKNAESRLGEARKRVVALQQKQGDISPLHTAEASMQIRTSLEGELAKARAEVLQLKAFMNAEAPQVLAANERVKALAAQVANESRRLVAPGETGALNTSLADFEAAMVEKEFAQKAYESALVTFEVARADADRQHRYLATIAAPSKPDESTYPHRARSVIATFVLSFLLLGVGSLLTAAVREHARL